MKQIRSLAALHQRQTPGVLLLLLGGLGLLLAGLFRPFTRVTKLWVFEDDVSVFSGLITLWNESEWFLFFVLLIFTVVFPLLKLLALVVLWVAPLGRERLFQIHRSVAHLGKWSMLDVFIVAILVLAVRSRGMADIRVQDGLFLFCLAVLLTQIASLCIGRIARRHLGSQI